MLKMSFPPQNAVKHDSSFEKWRKWHFWMSCPQGQKTRSYISDSFIYFVWQFHFLTVKMDLEFQDIVMVVQRNFLENILKVFLFPFT